MRQWIGSALVQIMVCRLFGAKPLSKSMLDSYQSDSIKIHNFSLTKMDLKMSSARCREVSITIVMIATATAKENKEQWFAFRPHILYIQKIITVITGSLFFFKQSCDNMGFYSYVWFKLCQKYSSYLKCTASDIVKVYIINIRMMSHERHAQITGSLPVCPIAYSG